MKKKIFEFGEIIPGLKIHGKDAPYSVLNERSVRAGAGILFVFAIISFFFAYLAQEYTLLSIFVITFAVEMAIRIFVNPKFAPIAALADFIVRKQKPDYVGAIQKKFAWSLGLGMAITMIFVVIIFQIRGTLPFSFCMVCLSLLWLETSCGICVGCKIYGGLQHIGWIKKPEVAPACPGGACAIPLKKK